MIAWIILILALLLVLFIYLYVINKKELTLLREMYEELIHDHRSVQVKHGQHFEHFVPFMHEFEHVASRENFHFLGRPVDGIAFEDDAIKFIEIKTGQSTLSEKQKRIKKLVEEKRVEWHELKFKK